MKSSLLILISVGALACSVTTRQAHRLVENQNGPSLGYSPSSGVEILEVDGLRFKDLNRDGQLDPYEDWRLPVDRRAADLASKMSIEQIAGLMLYSGHQAVPATESGYSAGTYDGRLFSAAGVESSALTDGQKKFLADDNLRHVLITSVESPSVAAQWNNNMQAFVEGIGMGIPCNTSSDPRHMGETTAEFNAGAGGKISVWPDGLGLGATFDPQIVKQFGEVASREYRALGITTALSPQIDMGTDPRWYRISMSFSESPELTTDMARAYIDGFQTSIGDAEIAGGWGYHSVNAMAKHWPGGGTGEAGRDAHWAFGKFGVYPGDNFREQIEPFVFGALNLDGPTSMTSAIMPYYTIAWNMTPDGTNLANGFNKWIITDLLREAYGYEGVVCTDWSVTDNEGRTPDEFAGKPWGVEEQTIAQRHYTALMAGVDQFGGNNDVGPVLEAYRMGVEEHGEEFMRRRFEQSAVRLLKNIFRLGLFENPYLDPAESERIVGNAEFMAMGYQAQLKSVVLLKNKGGVLPVAEKKTVYVPKVHFPAQRDWWGNTSEASYDYPINMDMVRRYYDVTDDPQRADFALVFVRSPHTHADGGGYDLADREAGGNGYVPISLQYGPYTATTARAQSIAAGDPVIDPTITNRSYRGKTTTVLNSRDLETILETREAIGSKPMIVVVNVERPMVFREFEGVADGIVARFGIPEQAVLDIISGRSEPSGLLPVQMPVDMDAVERQAEDVPFDMQCHVDSQGNTYDFGFGLDWSGVIRDSRNEKYRKPVYE